MVLVGVIDGEGGQQRDGQQSGSGSGRGSGSGSDRVDVDVGCTVVSSVSVGWVVLERFFLFLFFLRFVCVVDVVGVGEGCGSSDRCVCSGIRSRDRDSSVRAGARSGEVDSVEDCEDGDEERPRL